MEAHSLNFRGIDLEEKIEFEVLPSSEIRKVDFNFFIFLGIYEKIRK